MEKIWLLYGRNGPLLGKKLLFPTGEYTVGRESDNTIVLNDPSVSRHHGRLVVDSKNRLYVTDLHSSNGILLNGKAIEQAQIFHADKLIIGDIHFLAFYIYAKEAYSDEPFEPGATKKPVLHRLNRQMVVYYFAWFLTLMLSALVGTYALKWTYPKTSLGRSEQAFMAQQDLLLKTAQEQFQSGNFSASLVTSQDILLKHPLHEEARKIAVRSEILLKVQKDLKEVRLQMMEGRGIEALSVLQSLPDDTPWQGEISQTTQDILKQFKQRLLHGAQENCRGHRFLVCQEDAALVLSLLPQEIEAQALLLFAEQMMQAEGTAFTPYDKSLPGKALEELYPDAEVREAILYVTIGDRQIAAKRLVIFASHKGAAEAIAKLDALMQMETALHLEQNNSEKATSALLQKIIQHIDILVPAHYPDVKRSQYTNLWVSEAISLSQKSFDRGQYTPAFQALQAVLPLRNQQPSIDAALGRLEGRAQALLESTAALLKKSAVAADANALQSQKQACGVLKEILQMTCQESTVYQQAVVLLKTCPEP